MSASRANSFGSFLQTMNVSKSAPTPKGETQFDVETSAKTALQSLAAHAGLMESTALRDELALTHDDFSKVLAYLSDTGMISVPTSNDITLSGFGRDAMAIFAIS
jgi:hypothetical protein